MAHTVEVIAVGVPLRAYLVFTVLEPCVGATIYRPIFFSITFLKRIKVPYTALRARAFPLGH